MIRASFMFNLPKISNMWNDSRILVVIPCYRVVSSIEKIVAGLPQWVDSIVLIDDCSPDDTGKTLKLMSEKDKRITVIEHPKNMGVGGAMISGFRHALKTDCSIVVKMDGDGQMDPEYLPDLVNPIHEGKADFSKGNRFNDFEALRSMPSVRRIGNLALGFMIKAASGYWNIFDPTNGYFAISIKVLKKLDFSRLSNRYFFESSLIIGLYYTGARINEVAMPAIYGEEISNLSVTRALFGFPLRLLGAFFRRISLCYFIYDFNLSSIYLLAGVPLFLFGLIFGIVKWIEYASIDIAAPTGTVMLAVLPIVLGFQMLLAAVQHDIQSGNPFSSSG